MPAAVSPPGDSTHHQVASSSRPAADQIVAATLTAVEQGRLDPARIEDASRRTAALATTPTTAPAGELADAELAAIAARCLEVRGTVPRLVDPLVVECRTSSGMATGDLPWSFELSGADRLQIDGPTALPDRQVVLVVRDPQRHTWQQDLLARAHVVVDCGWPADIVNIPVIRTRGIAPALLRAAAHTLERA